MHAWALTLIKVISYHRASMLLFLADAYSLPFDTCHCALVPTSLARLQSGRRGSTGPYNLLTNTIELKQNCILMAFRIVLTVLKVNG